MEVSTIHIMVPVPFWGATAMRSSHVVVMKERQLVVFRILHPAKRANKSSVGTVIFSFFPVFPRTAGVNPVMSEGERGRHQLLMLFRSQSDIKPTRTGDRMRAIRQARITPHPLLDAHRPSGSVLAMKLSTRWRQV
mgnify:CR=1 FL=1